MMWESHSQHDGSDLIRMNLELLPRLVPDAYFDTVEEALAEVEERRNGPLGGDAVTRTLPSPYGGFRVLTVSRRLAMAVLSGLAEQGVVIASPGGSMSGHRSLCR